VTGTALIIIDVQNGLLANPALVHDADGVLNRIGQLVLRARNDNVPVIFVQHNGGTGHALEKPLVGWNIHTATGFRDGDTVVEKRECDAFQETDLQAMLNQLGVDRLVIAGMCSDYCVDTTCRRAYSLGYSVVLATDAHTTLSKDHMSATEIVRHHNAILGSGFANGQSSADIEFSNAKALA
jgi:nicotinamidase-related amidase